jgi:hypothetical protein
MTGTETPANALTDQAARAATGCIAAVEAFVRLPEAPPPASLRDDGRDLLAAAHLAGSWYKAELFPATRGRLDLYLRGAEAMDSLRRRREQLEGIEPDAPFARLLASQLSIRERDWLEDLRFALPRLCTEELRAKAGEEAQTFDRSAPLKQKPATWAGKQVASFARKQKRAFRERNADATGKLRRRADRLVLYARALPSADSATDLAPDAVVALRDALDEALVACRLEDDAIDLAEHSAFKGCGSLKKRLERHAREMLKAADSLRETLLAARAS